MTPEPDYSTYTLQQLLAARQWPDADGPTDRKSWLEDEIRKRCAFFQDAAKHLGPTSSGSATQYRPWGSIFGSAALEIGRASCRERVENWGVAGAVKTEKMARRSSVR